MYSWKNHIQWKDAKLKSKTGSGYKPLDNVEGILIHVTQHWSSLWYLLHISKQVSFCSVYTRSITLVFTHNIPDSQVLFTWSFFSSHPTCPVHIKTHGKWDLKRSIVSFKACFKQSLLSIYGITEFCTS